MAYGDLSSSTEIENFGIHSLLYKRRLRLIWGIPSLPSLWDKSSVVFLATGDLRLSSTVSPSEADVSHTPLYNKITAD